MSVFQIVQLISFDSLIEAFKLFLDDSEEDVVLVSGEEGLD